ncbi:MAG: GbsR/MarR family transcriptional regulator [Rhodoferax sp.]|jgi:DNA-binding transcriptional regulator GbsR (MarR family)|nr:GbsR/MarR family transcriptional regulator [Rhodoferax sp.]
MNLAPLTQKFVLHFGEMGSRWGINRTVGQIYALLYVTPEPLNADQLGESLGFSRSNVSMGLKELQSWGLVRLIHLPNDRREYFQAPEDVWAIFRTLAAERRKREIDPTLSMLRDALMEQPRVAEDIHAQERMRQMHAFIELMTDWLDDVQKMDSETLASLMKMGAQVQKLLEMKDRVKQVFSPSARTAAAPASGARAVEALPDASKDSASGRTSS